MTLLVAASRPRDYLTKSQQAEIAKDVATTSKPYWRLADEWLVTEATICRVAKKFGVGRKQ